MVDEHDRRATRDLGMREDAHEHVELLPTEVTGRDERGARHCAREADDRDGPAEPDARKAPSRHVLRELGQVAREERAEVVREAPLALDVRKVDVVVAGDDGDLGRTRDVLEQPHGFFVLTLEREVREVACDDDLIALARRRGEDSVEVVAPEDARAMEEHVCVARHALVEQHAPPVHAPRRDHMKIGDVGDAHGAVVYRQAKRVPSAWHGRCSAWVR